MAELACLSPWQWSSKGLTGLNLSSRRVEGPSSCGETGNVLCWAGGERMRSSLATSTTQHQPLFPSGKRTQGRCIGPKGQGCPFLSMFPLFQHQDQVQSSAPLCTLPVTATQRPGLLLPVAATPGIVKAASTALRNGRRHFSGEESPTV